MSSIARQRSKGGFTLVEILIVVVILGILAAVVIPQFTNASETAKSSSLLTQLQTLRSQIELYQVEHNGSYPDLSTDWSQMTDKTDVNGSTTAGTTPYGPYLQQDPVNPFTDSSAVAGSPTSNGTAAAGDGWVFEDGVLYAVMPKSKYDTLFPNGNTDIKTYDDSTTASADTNDTTETIG